MNYAIYIAPHENNTFSIMLIKKYSLLDNKMYNCSDIFQFGIAKSDDEESLQYYEATKRTILVADKNAYYLTFKDYNKAEKYVENKIIPDIVSMKLQLNNNSNFIFLQNVNCSEKCEHFCGGCRQIKTYPMKNTFQVNL